MSHATPFTSTPFVPRATRLLSFALAAVLLAAVADVDAKPKRRSSGKDEPAKTESSAPKIRVTVRNGSDSSTATSLSGTPGGDALVPIDGAAGSFGTSEQDTAERAARRAELERARAAKAEAAQEEALKAEAARQAMIRAAAEQAAAQARTEAARLEAEREKQRRAEALVAEDAERVLRRAMDDYPVLRTPAGEPVLQRIRERQQALVARGLYPSIAMVEAVADHQHALLDRMAGGDRRPAAVPVQAAAQAPVSLGNCRWATPLKWVCD